MSDLTDDQVRALLDGNELRSDSQSHTVWLLARALLQARADAAAAQRDHRAVNHMAKLIADEVRLLTGTNDGVAIHNISYCLSQIQEWSGRYGTDALAPDAGTAELAKLRERAEKAEQERVAEWNRRRDADGSRDAARAACDTMRAERDTLTASLAAQVARMHVLVNAVDFLRTTIRKNIVVKPGPHTVELPDGSVHSGPVADFLHELLPNIVEVLDRAALAAHEGESR